MSDFISMLILAVIQGLSEWLPISSSGHLVFFSHLLGFQNSIEFDVAVHFGTLMAVFVYFGKDITDIIESVLKGKWKSDNAKLAWMIILGSIPAGILGILFKKYFEIAFDSVFLTGICFLITAVILLIGSLEYGNNKEKIGWKTAVFVGFAQALAIFPGISRSGSTISAGLVSGMKMKYALRFSFLLAIPAVFGASIVELGNQTLPVSYLLPTFVAFLTGLATIHLMFRYLVTTGKNLRWFALYMILITLGLFGYLLI